MYDFEGERSRWRRRGGPHRALLFLEAPRFAGELVASHAIDLLAPRRPSGDGRPVLVIPGFRADDRMTGRVRSHLMRHDFRVHGWGLGPNIGLTDALIDGLVERFEGAAQAVRRPGQRRRLELRRRPGPLARAHLSRRRPPDRLPRLAVARRGREDAGDGDVRAGASQARHLRPCPADDRPAPRPGAGAVHGGLLQVRRHRAVGRLRRRPRRPLRRPRTSSSAAATSAWWPTRSCSTSSSTGCARTPSDWQDFSWRSALTRKWGPVNERRTSSPSATRRTSPRRCRS